MCSKSTALPKSHAERLALVHQVAKEKNLSVISVDVSTVKSHVVVHCNVCGKQSKGCRIDHFIKISKSPKCCANHAKKVAPGQMLIKLMDERGHELVGEMPAGRYDSFTFYCPKHEVEHETTYEKYKKTSTGAPCCGNELSAGNRVTTGESVGRKNPPWRISGNMVKWCRIVKKVWNGKCAITGKDSKEVSIEVHHLWDAASFPEQRFDPNCGLPLIRPLHRGFHKWNGKFVHSTPLRFIEYLQYLINESESGRYVLVSRDQLLKGIQVVKKTAVV